MVVFLDNPYISIILPTYNRPNILREAILSVIGQTYPEWELIVIDDYSREPVSPAIQDLLDRDSRVKCYRNLFRRNLPASKNVGISIAQYDLVQIMEDDMILDPDALRILVDAYRKLIEKDAMFGALAPSIPRVEYEERKDLRTVRERLMSQRTTGTAAPSRMSPFTGEISRDFTPKYRDLQAVGDVHACSLFLKRVLTEVQGYREHLYKGNYSREESDLTSRLKDRGYHFYFEPAAIFFHVYVNEGGCRVNYLEFMYYTVTNHTKFLYHNLGLVKTLYMAPLFVLWSLKGMMTKIYKYVYNGLASLVKL
jgi:glycosyltransferase involved in cell wall biosynthesis